MELQKFLKFVVSEALVIFTCSCTRYMHATVTRVHRHFCCYKTEKWRKPPHNYCISVDGKLVVVELAKIRGENMKSLLFLPN